MSRHDTLMAVTASLVAAIDILRRADDAKKRPSQVVASNKMFAQMLRDYENAVEAARAELRATDQQAAALTFCGPFPAQSEDERTLRRLLALAYAGAGELYGDDGELQLGGFPHPIDFRRMSVAEIETRIHARGMAKLVEQLATPRKTMREQGWTGSPGPCTACGKDGLDHYGQHGEICPVQPGSKLTKAP